MAVNDAGSSFADDHDDNASLFDGLAERLTQLRAQLEAIQTEGENALRDVREAASEARRTHGRIATLERLLAASRAQEERLTSQLIGEQATIEELTSRNQELTTMVARVAEFERDRAAAEARATQSENEEARVRLELSTVQDELQRARTRNAELRSDLSAAAVEVAAGEGARATAQRLAMERDEARDRAEEERRMAATDRIRAAELERRVAELEAREEPVVTPEPNIEDATPETPGFGQLEQDRGPLFAGQPSEVVDLRTSDPEDEPEDEPLIPRDPRFWR